MYSKIFIDVKILIYLYNTNIFGTYINQCMRLSLSLLRRWASCCRLEVTRWAWPQAERDAVVGWIWLFSNTLIWSTDSLRERFGSVYEYDVKKLHTELY